MKPKSCQWNIGCVGCQHNIFASSMYISCFLCRFHLRQAPNANPFFGGIWALSLYSTAMQNTWRWWLALANAPDIRILNWGYQHVGILEPTQTLKFALAPTPTPNASQWNIGGVGYPTQNLRVGHAHFMFLCRFHLRWVANANTVFSGIWAQTTYSGRRSCLEKGERVQETDVGKLRSSPQSHQGG